MPTPYNRLVRLVKVLTEPSYELIGPWWVGTQYIDTLELTYEGDIIIHSFNGDIDYEMPAFTMLDKDILELVEQLENILLN